MRNALKLTTPTDREIVVVREFDAPRELVWDSIFKPELLRRWFSGPPGWEMTTCEDDACAGRALSRGSAAPHGPSTSQSVPLRGPAPPTALAAHPREDCRRRPKGCQALWTVRHADL